MKWSGPTWRSFTRPILHNQNLYKSDYTGYCKRTHHFHPTHVRIWANGCGSLNHMSTIDWLQDLAVYFITKQKESSLQFNKVFLPPPFHAIWYCTASLTLNKVISQDQLADWAILVRVNNSLKIGESWSLTWCFFGFEDTSGKWSLSTSKYRLTRFRFQ